MASMTQAAEPQAPSTGHFALSPGMAQQLPLSETTPNPSSTARSASSEQAESHISRPTSSLRARQTQLWKAQAAHGHETLHHIRFTSHAHQACADAGKLVPRSVCLYTSSACMRSPRRPCVCLYTWVPPARTAASMNPCRSKSRPGSRASTAAMASVSSVAGAASIFDKKDECVFSKFHPNLRYSNEC